MERLNRGNRLTTTMRGALGVAALAGFVALAAPAASAPAQPPRGPGFGHDDWGLDLSFFYEELAPYGEWIEHRQFGWVWTPYNIPMSWRPYTRGHWAYTDCGWTWVSNEPFGWCVYHYGRWQFDPYYGWVWVPGYEWGPAWVDWRYGDGWIGWAPLPPNAARWRGGRLEVAFTRDEPMRRFYWNFVSARSFCNTNVLDHIVRTARNVNLFNVTQNVTNYVTINNVVVNQSVRINQIQPFVRDRITTYRLSDANVGGRPGRGDGRRDLSRISRSWEVRGGEIVAFRPKIAENVKVRKSPRDFASRSPGQHGGGQDYKSRFEFERKALEERLAVERRSLEERQNQERKSRPEYMKNRDLDKWQAEERAAFKEQEQRERKLLERYQDRLKDGKIGPTRSEPSRYKFDGRKNDGRKDDGRKDDGNRSEGNKRK